MDATLPTPSPLASLHARFNKLVVQAYKLAGFIALITILLGLVSYFAVHVFYFANHSWAKPVIVSPTDKQIVELRSQLAQQSTLRDNLATQRFELEARLEDQTRIITVEEAFQQDYARMLQADIEFRKKTLAKLARVSASHARAATAIAKANADFADVTSADNKALFEARLVNKDDAAKSAAQSANLATSNLGLDVKGVELDTQVSALERDIDSLAVADTMLTEATGKVPGAMSHDVLTMKRDYDRSKLDAARARFLVAALNKSIATTDASIGRYDALVKLLSESPYLRALDHHVAIAFVPYDNAGAAKRDTTIYACRASFVVCRKVGHVVDVLDGEASSKHPTQSTDLRGMLVEMELTDFHAAENPILHLGRAPLFL
jgi:hypothetical protein